MHKKNFTFTILIITVLFLLAGCSESSGDNGKKKLKIGVLPIEDILPMVVAEDKGYFDSENLDVELIPFQSAIESENAIQSGNLDGMVTDIIVATLLKNSGLDTKITSVTLGANPGENRFAIVAAPGSSIENMQDLDNKEIGISNNSIIEYVTDGLLENAGMESSEIQKVSIAKIPVRLEMLLNDQVDAITIPDPMVTYAEFEGAKVIADDTEQNLSQAVIIMEEDVLQESPEEIQGFYRAYSKAVQDINSSPSEFRELLVENARIPEPIKDEYQITNYPEPQLPAREDIDNVLKWLEEKELLKGELTYEDIVEEGIY